MVIKMSEFKKITIKNINKVFGSKKVLNNFNLTLEQGEFVTFLGPSGCGKSTALNCISGLIPITGGEVFIDEECIDNAVTGIPAEKRGFGMVFQSYALFPHLSVFNNVAFGLQIKKLNHKIIKERVDNILKLVHLEGYEDKFPSQMSGGEQQRVAIARCIIMEPKLLMLDEPLSNLDAKLRVDMRYELKALHDRLQITTVYVTHDQQEALALSDRIVVMKKGNIQQVGTPEQIYSEPANLFVADFMGFRNIWPAKIEKIATNGTELEITVNVNGVTLTSKSKTTADAKEHKSKLEEAFKIGQQVFTAIRPEDINLGDGSTNKISCKVDVVEYLGQVSQLAALMDNGTRVDLRPTGKFKDGERINLWIAPEKVKVFPKEEG